jgi:ribonucleotide monophosphatase NagD (HAD superfamily)
MIGDQLETDILGGNNFGIDTALVLTGVDRYTLNQKNLHLTGNMLPKYILRSLM